MKNKQDGKNKRVQEKDDGSKEINTVVDKDLSSASIYSNTSVVRIASKSHTSNGTIKINTLPMSSYNNNGKNKSCSELVSCVGSDSNISTVRSINRSIDTNHQSTPQNKRTSTGIQSMTNEKMARKKNKVNNNVINLESDFIPSFCSSMGSIASTNKSIDRTPIGPKLPSNGTCVITIPSDNDTVVSKNIEHRNTFPDKKPFVIPELNKCKGTKTVKRAYQINKRLRYASISVCLNELKILSLTHDQKAVNTASWKDKEWSTLDVPTEVKRPILLLCTFEGKEKKPVNQLGVQQIANRFRLYFHRSEVQYDLNKAIWFVRRNDCRHLLPSPYSRTVWYKV